MVLRIQKNRGLYIITSPSQNGNQNRIASAFANTDAGKQAQQLDAAMETSTQPLTEDLVIQNEPKQKSKLPLILAVLAVLVAIGVGGWVLIRSLSGDTDNDNSHVNIATLAESYNAYMNYLFYGTESTAPFSMDDVENYSIDYPNAMYAETVISEDSTDVDKGEYLAALQAKLEALQTSYAKQNGGSELSEEVSLYFYDYANIPVLSEQKLLRVYLQQGSEAAQNLIDSSFSTVGKSGDLLKYIEAQKQIAELNLASIQVANQHNCISNNTIQETCLSGYQNEIDSKLLANLNTAYADVYNIPLALRRAAMNALMRVYYQIYDETNEQGEAI